MRDTDGIVESETKGLVHILTALATIEEVLLQEVTNSEQVAASCVGRGVDTVGASNSPCDGSYGRKSESEVNAYTKMGAYR